MRVFWRGLSCLILFGMACMLLTSGIAVASTGTDTLQASSTLSRTHSSPSACLSPLVLASGGLCCPGKQSSMEPCVSSNPSVISAAVGKLKPLVVNGVQIPLPVTLQMVKKALGRKWSMDVADRNVMVCRFRKIPGGRIPLLHCSTNYLYFKSFVDKYVNVNSSHTKVHCYSNCFLTERNIIFSLARYVDNDIYTAKVLGSLLGKVPAETATYSLRMPETVPMWLPAKHLIVSSPKYVTFVIGDGGLLDIQLSVRHGKIKVVEHKTHYNQPKGGKGAAPSLGSLCDQPSVSC